MKDLKHINYKTNAYSANLVHFFLNQEDTREKQFEEANKMAVVWLKLSALEAFYLTQNHFHQVRISFPRFL